MLMVIHPFALVSGALGVDEGSATISHAVEPLPLVDATIGLDHASEAAHLVVDELALVLGAIRPNQDAKAILDLAISHQFPLSLVLLGHVLFVHSVNESAVYEALLVIVVNLVELCVAEKRWATLVTVLGWLAHVS